MSHSGNSNIPYMVSNRIMSDTRSPGSPRLPRSTRARAGTRAGSSCCWWTRSRRSLFTACCGKTQSIDEVVIAAKVSFEHS